MKRILFNLLFCCTVLIVASCKNEATISGTADKIKELGLYSFNKGEIALVQSVPVDPQEGTYTFVANLPYKGLYLFGRNEGALYPLYLNGGEEIVADFSNNDMFLSGNDLSEENQILGKWENGVNDVKVDAFMCKSLPGASASGYEIFFDKLSSAYQVQKSLLSEISNKQGDFYGFMRKTLVLTHG